MRSCLLTILLVAASACGGDDERPGALQGVWSGVSAEGLSVSVLVETETPISASLAGITGVLRVGDERCLRASPLDGTRTGEVLELSAWGAGSVSASTFVEIQGVLSGHTVSGTIEVSGDGKIEACDLQRQALTLDR